MILWILAILLLGILGVVGFYQGAVRVGISTIGLLVAALLAVPLSGIFKFILPVTGLSHPAVIALVAPLCMYLLLLIVFKVGGVALHKKVEWYYKNKAPDTKRMLWERMNARLGICVGILNGAIYLVLICVLVYVLGYFTVPLASSPKDSVVFKVVNTLANDMQSTKMDKAVAGFVPATSFYYDSVDVLSMIFHTPLLQGRLATYPAFLSLAERPEFQELGKDLKFQEFWQGDPSLTEFRENEKMGTMINNVELYTNVVGIVQGDLKDLKTYLETGKSAKYDDDKILGKWKIEYNASLAAARKKKANMNRMEIQALMLRFSLFKDAELKAMVDKSVSLRMAPPKGSAKVFKGTWSGTGDNYTLNVGEGSTTQEIPVTVNGNKLVATKDGFSLSFSKE
ncbi:MAG: Colicin production protein [Verrucomicrobiales bacterium]|nr:Colicin production protein [Verrucomicrobiales bacterium]